MATWWGTSEAEVAMGWFRPDTVKSNRHDVLFLAGDKLVNIGNKTVGELLDFFLRTALLVFGGQFVLDQLLDAVIGITAQVANRHLGMLALGTHDLGELPCGALRSWPAWGHE